MSRAGHRQTVDDAPQRGEPAQNDAADRRRILLVDSADELSSAVTSALQAAGLDCDLTQVDDYLTALGHLATTDAGDLPQFIIGSVDQLADPVASTAASLRRLCPGAALVLVARADGERQAIGTQRDGFDRYVLEPIEPAQLAAVLRSIELDQRTRPDPTTAAAYVQTVMRGVHRSILADEFHGLAAASCEAFGHHPTSGELGDTDLIEQLLSGQPGFVPFAVKVLSRHSGIAGIDWSRSAEQLPADHASVAIRYFDDDLGVLHAPRPATQQQLEPWAGWLARWLALRRWMQRLWHLALHDELTGVWNRRYLTKFLDTILSRASRERFAVTVMVFDIDDFKSYNDHFGHAAGDEILRESARLMISVVRDHDVVARLGGDEFAVVFWDAERPRQPNSEHPDSIRKAAMRFQQAICQHRFPKLAEEALDTLTISGGLAGFPWDGRTAEQLLDKADEMALQSKRQGKNVMTYGPGAQKTCQIMFPDQT